MNTDHAPSIQPAPPPPDPVASAALWAGGLAALLASTCCLGPLLLVLLGFSGAWIGSLTQLEPYRPNLLLGALAALLLARRRLWPPRPACTRGQFCAQPAVRRGYRVLFWLAASAVALALLYPYLAPLFY